MVHTLERWLRQETNEEVQEKICMALELMTCTEIHPQRRRQSARLAEFIVNLTLVKFRQTYWVMEEHTPKPFLGNSIKDVTGQRDSVKALGGSTRV
ncbi:Coproporphyrin III ferrochelatase [Dirofilaria immitis]